LLRDFRNWLESELKLLGNASHHAYSFGQANMAKRALDKLDAELEQRLYVPLEREEARRALAALEGQTDPALEPLREALRTALA
jgi:hypothetical protein